MNNRQSCLFQLLALSFPMAFFPVCRPQCLHGTYSQPSASGYLARSTPSDLLEGSNREFQKSKISRFHDGPWWCANLALENCCTVGTLTRLPSTSRRKDRTLAV